MHYVAIFLILLLTLPPSAQDIEDWRKRAKQGDVLLQSALGAIYYEGKVVPQDYAEAEKWFRMAADQGDDTGQDCPALCCFGSA